MKNSSDGPPEADAPVRVCATVCKGERKTRRREWLMFPFQVMLLFKKYIIIIIIIILCF